jgi:membrane-associated phospholipid phosphatase
MESISDLTEKRFLHGKDRMWLLLGAITLIFFITFYFDKLIINFVKEQVSNNTISVASFIQYYGNLPLYSTFLFILLYSLVKNIEKLKKLSWAYIKAQLIFSIILIRVLKIFFGRFRPRYGSEFTFFSLDFTRNSFPSGHATDAFISGVFLFYVLKYSKYSKYRFLPLIYAFIIALSRIACYAHFASDVIAGMAIGVFGAVYFLERISPQTADTGKVR